MAKTDKTSMTDAIMQNYPWSTETLAEELDMNLPTFRVWKAKVEKEGKITKPAIGSLLCVQDPEFKHCLRYSDEYLEKLKIVRGNSATRRRRTGGSSNGYTGSTSSLKHAVIQINVPIFDKVIADLIMKKFGDVRGIEEHLKDHIRNIATPALTKLEELKRRHEEELQEILANF